MGLETLRFSGMGVGLCQGCTELGSTLHTREELEDWLRFEVVSRSLGGRNMAPLGRFQCDSVTNGGIPERTMTFSCTTASAQDMPL